MACACKVNKYLDSINNKYGSPKQSIKTNIRGDFGFYLKKFFIYLIYIPAIPLMILFLIFRGLTGNKPISINGLIKRNKNVRNK